MQQSFVRQLSVVNLKALETGETNLELGRVDYHRHLHIYERLENITLHIYMCQKLSKHRVYAQSFTPGCGNQNF